MSFDNFELKHKGQSGTNKDVLEKIFRQSISSSDISQRDSLKDLSKIAKELEAKRAARKDDSSSDEQAEESKKKRIVMKDSIKQFMYKDITILPSVEACQPTAAQLEKMSSCDFCNPMKSRKMKWNIQDVSTCQDVDSDTSNPNVTRSKSEIKELEKLKNKIRLQFDNENANEVTPSKYSQNDKLPELSNGSYERGANNRIKFLIFDALRNLNTISKKKDFKAEKVKLKVDGRSLMIDRGSSSSDSIIIEKGIQSEGISGLPNKLSSLVHFVAQTPINPSEHLMTLLPLTPSIPVVMPNIQTVGQVCQPNRTPFSQLGKCQDLLLTDILAMINEKCPFPPVYMYTTPCQSPECKYEFPILPPRKVDKAAQPKCVERKFISISKLNSACRDGCLMHIINFLEEVYTSKEK